MRWLKEREKLKKYSCVFCEIVKENKEIPHKIIHRGKKCMVIMNMYPYNTGHLLVIPKRHVVDIDELEKEEVEELADLVIKSKKLLDKALNPKGYNIGVNIGFSAGASIEHLHVHIVPRFERDFGFMEVISSTKVLPASIDEVYSNLMKHYREVFEC